MLEVLLANSRVQRTPLRGAADADPLNRLGVRCEL